MKTTNRLLVAAALAIVHLAWGTAAMAQQGPVGQGLGDAGRAVKRGFQSAGQAVSGGYQKTKTGVHNMEVVSRVYSRLHWDKALFGSTVEIDVQAGGVAILTGTVGGEQAKAKALALTAETVGVVRVVDQLTVAALVTPAPVVQGASPAARPTRTLIVTPPATTTP